jgi:hypothetical protein
MTTDIDPTAFPIEFDPTVQRMRGRAIHGNTPFDVPFISELDHNLWQGGCENGLVLPPFITSVLSLYKWEHYDVQHPCEVLTVTMYDSATEPVDRDQIIELAEWVNDRRKAGPVLVHCQAGLNRSSLVASAALILGGLSPEAAIEQVRQRRSPACLCNSTFEAWVRGFRP